MVRYCRTLYKKDERSAGICRRRYGIPEPGQSENSGKNRPYIPRQKYGRSGKERDYRRKARSATEGLIAVAKNLRGFGRSLYRGVSGDRIWSSLCRTACNLKKFLQLYREEKIEEGCLVKLGLPA
ncbi:hypothetical protein QUF90_17950 [Desulfococcaceae bacterium HSG9]|nr:hypothetical protein [Desulfococcaceae bacterium HSG9]